MVLYCRVAGRRAEEQQRRADDLADELETARKRGEARAKDLSRQLQAALKRLEQLEAVAGATGSEKRPASSLDQQQPQTRQQALSSSSGKRTQSPTAGLGGGNGNNGNGKNADTHSLSSRGSNEEFVVVDDNSSSPLNLSGGPNDFSAVRKQPAKKPSSLMVTSPSPGGFN